jgi:hypothetical protein
MGHISPSQVNTNDSIVKGLWNDPVNTITNEFNGNIDDSNIKIGAAIATAKLATDAGITRGMLQNGLIRYRQGSTTGDNSWQTPGGNNTDVSTKTTFIQAGSSVGTGSGDFAITFPVAFTQVPLIVATVTSASGANAVVQITIVTTTTFTCRVHRNADNVDVAENFNWIAIGQ